MFIQIRNDDQITGLKIDDSIIKLSAYADDTYIIPFDVPSFQQVFIICNTFEEFLSLKLNFDKCQACLIGSAKSKLDTPIDCNWLNIEKDKILTLGIFMDYLRMDGKRGHVTCGNRLTIERQESFQKSASLEEELLFSSSLLGPYKISHCMIWGKMAPAR